MARFNEIGTATIPGNGTRLRLLQRNDEFSIKIAGAPGELMNSRLHGSEDALATARSHVATSWQPAAVAMPSTSAIVGTASPAMSRMAREHSPKSSALRARGG